MDNNSEIIAEFQTNLDSLIKYNGNTAIIPAYGGLYTYNPLIISLWNNNKPVDKNTHIEQWVEFNSELPASIGLPPTIINGVITNIPIGVYNFNITGTLYQPSCVVAELQYKPTGGTFNTAAMSVVGYVPFDNSGAIYSFASISINATIRILSTTDSIQLYYNNNKNFFGFGNGQDPGAYQEKDGTYSSLSRYMTITFVSL
jgi:hypothetical protein